MKVPAETLTASGKVRKKPGRVPVSCAECRRLKMKCDRGVPCENCSKRGCATICPEGTLTTGKHNRMILSNTEELHDQIESLLNRVRLLEDALRTLQASVSTHPHPLLSNSFTDGLHSVSFSNVPSVSAENSDVIIVADDGVGGSDSHGTLSIGTDGEMSFLGPTARTDYLMINDDFVVDAPFRRLPRQFYAYSWPEPPDPDPNLAEKLQSFLPDLPEARALCHVYSNVAEWIGFFLLPTNVIYDEFLAHVYHLPDYSWHNSPDTCPQILALLFSIFALAALFDPTKPRESTDSADYFQLAKVALSCKSKVQNTSVYTIFALINMSHWLFHQDAPASQESGYLVIGIASRLSSAMGLHLDSSHWNICEDLARKRHAAFWQLYILEANVDIYFGRQPSLTDAVIDAPLPDNIAGLNTRHYYLPWLIQFRKFERSIVLESYKSYRPSYLGVLELHTKVCNYPEPDWQQMRSMLDNPDDPTQNMYMQMKQARVGWYRNILLLYLHRGFLIQALHDSPRDPLSSKYATSVRECYEASRKLGDCLVSIAKAVPHDSARGGCWFSAALISCVIKTVIATRCSSTEFAQPAVHELDEVYSIMRQLSIHKKTYLRGLEIISRLRDAAHRSLCKPSIFADGTPVPSNSPEISSDDMNMMERCCGKTQTWLRRTERTVSSPAVTPEPSLTHVQSNTAVSTTPMTVPRLPRIHDTESGAWDTTAGYQYGAVDNPGPVPSALPTIPYPMIVVPSMSREAGMSGYTESPRYTTSSGGWSTETGLPLDPAWTHFVQQLGF